MLGVQAYNIHERNAWRQLHVHCTIKKTELNKQNKVTCAFNWRVVSYWPIAFLDSIIFEEHKNKCIDLSKCDTSHEECKTKTANKETNINLQPLAFPKLVLELIYLLLTLKHNKYINQYPINLAWNCTLIAMTTTWTLANSQSKYKRAQGKRERDVCTWSKILLRFGQTLVCIFTLWIFHSYPHSNYEHFHLVTMEMSCWIMQTQSIFRGGILTKQD